MTPLNHILDASLLNRSLTINNQLVVLKYSPATYSPFLGGYTIECVEVYINGSYMDNFTDLDSLNDYINDL